MNEYELFAPMPVKIRYDKWVKPDQPRNSKIDFGVVAWTGVVTIESTTCAASDGASATLAVSRRTAAQSEFPTFGFTIMSADGISREYAVSQRGRGITSNGSILDIVSASESWYWRKRRFGRPHMLRASGEPIVRVKHRMRGPLVTVLAPVVRAELDLIAVTWIAGFDSLCSPATLP